MNLVTGAMGSLLPKLAELLKEEYKLKKSVKDGVRSLEKEMQSMHAALRKVAEVPRDQLDEQVSLWAAEVRELSFDMEDVVDKFLLRVDDDGSKPATNSNRLKRLTDKLAGLFTRGKARHEIADAIKEINKQVQEVANRRERYNVDSIISTPAAVSTIDPRLGALYKEVSELVGIVGKRDQELMRLLSKEDGDETKNKLRTVSVVGFGGLGKTTLVKTVYDKIKPDFDCNAFVPVGRNADAKKILMEILLDLGMYKSHFSILNAKQLIDKLQQGLMNKRYLIVIDDIWDGKLWEVINLAFSKSNNLGSRLITTTRIVSVSRVCCSSTDDTVYKMEPLSDDDSKRLFYKRIFPLENGCPRELEEVSIEILKKCGGVPLAIITVASLLAGDQRVKHVDEWIDLLGSIGRGLKEDPSVNEMLKILSFSYYDLPSHLKTCLLYLSMFPEDHEIKKDKLIWMWIAEGFVQSKKGKTSLFEIGETYFNELVNRNMIMPVYYKDYGHIAGACRVHDMVLDLITSLASEDNFVTVLNGTDDSMSSQSNVRRLSLQNTRKGELQAKPLKPESVSKVRSVAAFGPGICLVPSFSSFVVLRVLDLTGCDLGDHSHLNLHDLGSMLHLRYLGLAYTRISMVPEEVGKLQFLLVLDLSQNDDVELPSSIIKLTRLMCLLVDRDHKRLPEGLENLASLEVLHMMSCDSISTVIELGGMEKLRELSIIFSNWNLQLEKAFVESLGKMSNIQRLEISWYGYEGMQAIDVLGERWMPPQSLESFYVGYMVFSTVPVCIRRDPSHLSQLSVLDINVKEAWQEDLDVLGRLPALRDLSLWMERWSGVLLFGADGFRCLTSIEIDSSSPGQIVFKTGAMPKAERVVLRIGMRVINEQAVGNDGDYSELGMRNLPSLGKADVRFFRFGVTIGEAKRAEAALANALGAHPNHPTFHISFYPYIPADAADDDIYYEYKAEPEECDGEE